MSTLETILEILKYVLPSVVVLVACALIVNKFLIKETQEKQLAIFGQKTKEILALRMQAYERLTHFVERIHPNALIGRHYRKGAEAQDVQLSMIRNIREEYEHNLSQQIYVSNEVWQAVRSAKEQEIAMINQIGAQLKPGTPAMELVSRISEFALTEETELPTDIALFIINREAKEVLLAGE